MFIFDTHYCTLLQRTRRSEDARAYNELITSWSALKTASQGLAPSAGQKQFDFQE